MQGPAPFGPVQYSFIRQTIRTETSEQWNNEWLFNPACRQTKLWFPEAKPGISRFLLKQTREDLGRLIRWFTGHNFLRRHQNLLDPDSYTSRICRLCYTEPETAEHIVADCVTLDHTRRFFMGTPSLTKPYEWDISKLHAFLAYIGDKLEDSGPISAIQIVQRDDSWGEVFIDSTASGNLPSHSMITYDIIPDDIPPHQPPS